MTLNTTSLRTFVQRTTYICMPGRTGLEQPQDLQRRVQGSWAPTVCFPSTCWLVRPQLLREYTALSTLRLQEPAGAGEGLSGHRGQQMEPGLTFCSGSRPTAPGGVGGAATPSLWREPGGRPVGTVLGARSTMCVTLLPPGSRICAVPVRLVI